MTNPFATFRKNQKAWMAGLVLVAIFAFVIAPFFTYFGDGQNRAAVEATAVRWNGGKLSVGDIQRLSQQHSSLARFLAEVAQRVIEQGGRPNVPGFRIDPTSGSILSYGIPIASNPTDIVQTKVLATYGKSLGVSFDDEAVDQFLMAYVNNKLSSQQVEEILREASNGQLSYYEVRELLKDDLCFMVVQQLAITGLFTEDQMRSFPLTTPGDTFNNFLKLNQSAIVEAFPVFADEYMDQVTSSPSEGEIEAIYSVGSTRISDPRSPDPGFARSYKANLEYVEASLQDWIEKEKSKLSEEELKAEYDRRVALGQLQVPVEENSSEGEESPEQSKPEEDTATTPAESTEAEDPTPSQTEEMKADSAPQGSDSPGAQEPAKEEPAKEEPAKEEPAKEEPAKEEPAKEEPAKEEPAKEETSQDDGSGDKPQNDDQGRLASPGIRLVSYLQDEPKSDDPAAENTPAEAPAPQNNDGEAQPTGEGNSEPAVGENSANSSDETSEPAPETATSEPQETPGADAAAADSNAATASESGPQMRTQTFEEAKDTVADSIARDKAIQSLDEALTSLLQDHMQAYYAKYRQYEAFKDSGVSPKDGEENEKPTKPNIQKIATDLGLEYEETGMVDGYTLAQTPFGQGNIAQASASQSVANTVMAPGVELFRPFQSSYFDRQAVLSGEFPEFLQYIFWKTEQQEAYIPELSEVREEVVEAWKRLKARQLAENAARDLAKKVGNGEKPWDDALSETQKTLVVETNPFTWINQMGEFMTVSPVDKLETVGNDFMREVFTTQEGGTTVAPSANRDIFYVIRVKEFSESSEALQQRFLNDPLKFAPKTLSNNRNQELIRAWINDLEQKLDLQWEPVAAQVN